MTEILHIAKSNRKLYDSAHIHKVWEIICNIEGHGSIVLNDAVIPFDERTIMCVPPNVSHKKVSDDGFVDIWIWINEFNEINQNDVTILSDDYDRNIMKMINVLHSVHYDNIPNRAVVQESLTDSIKQLIISRSHKDSPNERVENIINQIINNFHNPDFSIQKCLASQGYCSDHMRRLFIEETGKAPHVYLHDIRMNAAKKLLLNMKISSNTISDIAYGVGYNDICYFSRDFKRTFGVCPTKYIKK